MEFASRYLPHGLVIFLCGCLLGVLPWVQVWIFPLVLGLAFLVALIFSRRRGYVLGTCMLAMLLLGIARGESWERSWMLDRGQISHDTSATLEVMVSREPDQRESLTHLTAIVRQVDGQVPTRKTHVRISVLPYPTYAYGDILRVSGKITYPEAFMGESGRLFDYPMYLATKGVTHTMYLPSVRVLGREGHVVMHGLYAFKAWIVSRLQLLYPDPHQALLSGMLLGEKRSLGEEWIDYFTRAGIIHIVVLSGYNMTIVAEWMMFLFRGFGFRISLALGALGIMGFTFMTGAGATVVRAGIMALLVLLARATGRPERVLRMLIIAGALMVAHEPAIVVYDPSFQLSFLATLGLVLIAPLIDARLTLFRAQPLLREVIIATCATQLMVLPFLLYLMGMFSFVALPINVMILPFIPLAMLLGTVSIVASIIPLLGFVVSVPTIAILELILNTARAGAELPYATALIPVSFTMMVLLYLMLCVLWYRTSASD